MKRLTGALGALLVAMALFAPGAGAIGFQSAGSFTDPAFNLGTRAIAVDPESGNVYLANLLGVNEDPEEPGTILRFDATGTPLSPASMGTGYYLGVAVEQGGDHTVYAYDSQFNGDKGTPSIDAFDSAGSALGSPFPFDVNAAAAQIASDPAGNVYFPDTTTNTVKKYTALATAGTPAEFACTGTDCNSTALNTPRGAAVDAAGNVYVADTENNRVVKFAPDGSFDSVFYEGAAFAIALDPTSETVLVAGNDGSGQHVTALDYAGNVVGEIPTTEFEGAFVVWLAVNPTTETLYALGFGQSEVSIFNILVAPSATTGSASGVASTTATLNATVNPNGVINEDCHFEYTDDVDFQANEWTNATSVPCEPEPFDEETDVAVSAEVSGLSPETTYDFRVVQSTEGGTAQGAAEQFTTTAPAPTVSTEAATGISQSAATLNGKVDAEGDDASCEFEYGTTTAYGKSVPCSVNPVTGTTATAVSASLAGLTANATYHYRVVAENGGGESLGTDMTFATLADTCQTNAALCPPPPPPPPPPGGEEPPRNEAAYKVCVKKATKSYKKALKKAHTPAQKKAAKSKKKKAIKKCAAKYL